MFEALDTSRINENVIAGLLEMFTRKDNTSSHAIRPGTGYTMISASHSVEQTRNGAIKYGEYQTGVLAELLHRQTGCHTIYKTHNCSDDANFDVISSYRNDLNAYIHKAGIKYLIDLHQMAPTREQSFHIGTGNWNNLQGRNDIVDYIVETLEKYGPVYVGPPFDASGECTVARDISCRCRIPCVQLEINSKLVCEEYEEYCLLNILGSLRSIVTWLNTNETQNERDIAL